MSTLTRNQVKTYGPKFFKLQGEEYKITAEARHDDQCGNGHNTFSITGDIRRKLGNGRWVEVSCGCIHEDIKKHFPELAPLIKWHLTSTDGPMHYAANTVYHAGDRDHWGKRKGEVRQYEETMFFGTFPIADSQKPSSFRSFIKNAPNFAFRIIACEHNKEPNIYGTHYTYDGHTTSWYEAPFRSREEAENFLLALQAYPPRFVLTPCAWGEGKARDFAAARSTAVWPEATDEQLSTGPEELTRMLEARLPALLKEFREAVESLGFVY
jgi:hypothetical protein